MPETDEWYKTTSSLTLVGEALQKPYNDPVEQERLDRVQLPLAANKPRLRAPIALNVNCSCVLGLFSKTKDPSILGYGLAKLIPVTNKIGQVGDYIITDESIAGHIVQIIDETAADWIVEEWNYVHCQHTTGRHLAKDSPDIIGFH